MHNNKEIVTELKSESEREKLLETLEKERILKIHLGLEAVNTEYLSSGIILMVAAL